jgi:Ankyrin repeats (3 copies)
MRRPFLLFSSCAKNLSIESRKNLLLFKPMISQFSKIGLFLILASLCGCGGPATLHSAAAADNDAQVLTFLQQGRPINSKDGLGYTPLHWTAYYGSLKAAKVLVAHGADLEATEANGMTPLTLAVYNETTPVITYLLQCHANPNAVDDIGWTPLCYSAANGDVATTNLLIAAGAEVNPTKPGQIHPLSVAKGKEVARLLVQHGAT